MTTTLIQKINKEYASLTDEEKEIIFNYKP